MNTNIDLESPPREQSAGRNDLGWMRVLPLAGMVASVGYLLFMGFNISLFSYYPAINEFHTGPTRLPAATSGPPMFWYGWILNSILAGAGAGIVALLLPKTWMGAFNRHLGWLVWFVPVAVFVVMVYTHWHFFE